MLKALAQAPLFGDIGVRADDAHNAPLRIARQHPPLALHPAVAAVLAAQAVHAVVIVPPVFTLRPGRFGAPHIVGVDAHRPFGKGVANLRILVAQLGFPGRGKIHLLGLQIGIPHALASGDQHGVPQIAQRLVFVEQGLLLAAQILLHHAQAKHHHHAHQQIKRQGHPHRRAPRGKNRRQRAPHGHHQHMVHGQARRLHRGDGHHPLRLIRAQHPLQHRLPGTTGLELPQHGRGPILRCLQV